MKPAVALGAVAAGAVAMAYAVRGRSSALLAPSVYQGVSTRRAIALTFDDGPSESTPRILELLSKHDAPSTFFQCGVNVRRLPEVARDVVESGHEIGNHSDTHPYLCFKGHRFILDQLRRTQEAIAGAVQIQARLFRAPYGVRWFGLRDVQTQLGLMGVMWTTIGLDWKLSAAEVTNRVVDSAKNGAIVCLHDGRTTETRPDVDVTVKAVAELLPRLIDKGYHFERVSDILCPTI